MSDRSFNVLSDGRAVAATTSIVFSVNTATDVTPRLAAAAQRVTMATTGIKTKETIQVSFRLSEHFYSLP